MNTAVGAVAVCRSCLSTRFSRTWDLRQSTAGHQPVTSLEDMQHADVDAAPGNGGSPDLFGCARPQFPSKLARWATGSRPRYRRGIYAVKLIPMKAWKRLIKSFGSKYLHIWELQASLALHLDKEMEDSLRRGVEARGRIQQDWNQGKMQWWNTSDAEIWMRCLLISI
jgi:hypothetical protein